MARCPRRHRRDRRASTSTIVAACTRRSTIAPRLISEAALAKGRADLSPLSAEHGTIPGAVPAAVPRAVRLVGPPQRAPVRISVSSCRGARSRRPLRCWRLGTDQSPPASRRLAVLYVVHLHDLRLAGVSAELLHDGHQRLAETSGTVPSRSHTSKTETAPSTSIGAMEPATWNLTDSQRPPVRAA